MNTQAYSNQSLVNDTHQPKTDLSRDQLRLNQVNFALQNHLISQQELHLLSLQQQRLIQLLSHPQQNYPPEDQEYLESAIQQIPQMEQPEEHPTNSRFYEQFSSRREEQLQPDESEDSQPNQYKQYQSYRRYSKKSEEEPSSEDQEPVNLPKQQKLEQLIGSDEAPATQAELKRRKSKKSAREDREESPDTSSQQPPISKSSKKKKYLY